MTAPNSVFHSLQKRSATIRARNLRPGYEVALDPFLNKISGSIKAPFPIYVAPRPTMEVVDARFDQLIAVEGLALDNIKEEDLSEADINALADLAYFERFQASLPAQSFGVELFQPSGKPLALVFEAMKYENIPYKPEECTKKKIEDCRYLRIHSVMPDEDAPLSSDGNYDHFILHDIVFFASIRKEDQKYYLKTYMLGPDACRITKQPSFGAKNADEIFHSFSEEQCKIIYERFEFYLATALNLLWVMTRDPLLLVRNTSNFNSENSLARHLKKPQLSPIHTVLIDREHLRRIESSHATEIAEALATKGGYTIPGLVLVGEHERRSKPVEAYARCADELVRHRATDLLRAKDYDSLAVLVREFGARTTKERYNQSPTFLLRIAPGS